MSDPPENNQMRFAFYKASILFIGEKYKKGCTVISIKCSTISKKKLIIFVRWDFKEEAAAAKLCNENVQGALS